MSYPEGAPRGTERERRQPYVWVTWLSSLMVGEVSCLWSPWFKTNYPRRPEERVPGDFDLVRWQIEHTRMVHELVEKREAVGEKVFFEGQNEFRFQTESGLTLAGRPDLITISNLGKPEEIEIYDCKTGQPRDSNQAQMMIYMFCLPRSTGRWKDKNVIVGHLLYREQQIDIHPETMDDRFTDNLSYFLKILEGKTPPRKNPSERECRWCDIAKTTCPERV